MRENALQDKCIDWLRTVHPDIVLANIHGGGWGAKGFPDLITCIHGRFVAFELKVGNNDMDAAQRIWKKRIERAGGVVYKPYTLEEFQSYVRNEYEAGKLV